MFTGLVQGLGAVSSVGSDGPGIELCIAPPPSMRPADDPVTVGESIAVGGCCLTVVRTDDQAWWFQAGAETLARTNLGTLRAGDPVNLERALRATDRLGGHFVQGHIDALGRVDALDRDGEWTTMWIRVSPALTGQMVEKGSVAVDGVSLTLVTVEAERFSVALIPHTLHVTTLGRRQPGDLVNIETDILGKYVEKMLSLPAAERLTPPVPSHIAANPDSP